MLYFIPSWYQKNQWCENEQSWRVRRTRTEFDDTVKQVQLFHRSGAYPYRIILLGFAPNLRHFLHRQGVFHASYWSCFDVIQEIRRTKSMVFSFHNLNWPLGTEFVYTPFVIIAMIKGEKYAQIDLGEDGNPIYIDLYKNGETYRRNVYDDRGFVSSTIRYENGKPLYQDYLMENGIWKMRCFQKDGHVEINTQYPNYQLLYQGKKQVKRFSRCSYESMNQVIYEILVSYLSLVDNRDIFCVAMHDQHTKLLKTALQDRKMILSFFADRYSVADHSEGLDMIERADYIITDSRENLKKIRWEAGALVKNITFITPYDSRVDFGISQQLDVQKVLVPVDNISDIFFKELIKILGKYLYINENVQVHIFTRNADYDREQRLLNKIHKILQMCKLNDIFKKFFVEQCVDELAVSKCMREQKLLIDLRNIPELYLQVMAISIGIPQIVRSWTEFVENGRNGIVLKDIKKLSEAMDYYLDGFKHWNEAMVCSYELSKEYTTDRLLEEWKEVITSVG